MAIWHMVITNNDKRGFGEFVQFSSRLLSFSDRWKIPGGKISVFVATHHSNNVESIFNFSVVEHWIWLLGNR